MKQNPDVSRAVFHNADGEVVEYDGSPLQWRVSVYGVVIENGKVLLLKDRSEVLYDIPGGGIEFGESIEATFLREGKEEVGVELQPTKLFDARTDFFYHREKKQFFQTLQLFYLAKRIGEMGTPLEADIEEVKWVNLEEVVKYKLPVAVEQVIQKILAMKSYPGSFLRKKR
jgi:8-oxo-dGTP pyrophosphatase MutT (NUDIX family)